MTQAQKQPEPNEGSQALEAIKRDEYVEAPPLDATPLGDSRRGGPIHHTMECETGFFGLTIRPIAGNGQAQWFQSQK